MLEKRGVLFLESEYERTLFECYLIAVKSNGFGLEVSEMVVDKYCEKYGLDFIEIFSSIKSFANA